MRYLLDKVQSLNIKVFKEIYLFDILSLLSRLILGVIFLVAAIDKIPNLNAFEGNVSAYHMLPLWALGTFSYTLPWLELFLGFYLITGLFQRFTSVVTILSLLIFITAITYAIVTNQPVSGCGCFSQSAGTGISWWDDVRDVFFIILALILFFINSKFLSIDSLIFKSNKAQEEKEAFE